jgi:hypothetical protein
MAVTVWDKERAEGRTVGGHVGREAGTGGREVHGGRI